MSKLSPALRRLQLYVEKVTLEFVARIYLVTENLWDTPGCKCKQCGISAGSPEKWHERLREPPNTKQRETRTSSPLYGAKAKVKRSKHNECFLVAEMSLIIAFQTRTIITLALSRVTV